MRLFFILFCVFIGGCSKFSCGQFPSSGCQPVSHVYERTNDGFHDYRAGLNQKRNSSSSHHHHGHHFDDKIRVGQAHRDINRASPGDPILTQPVIMRVLFAPWEDKQKDLNIGGYVYVKIRDGEWVLSH